MTAHEPEREPLNTERIVGAAITIADAAGLDAVSMRRIASDLGSGTMSLYRHVPTREILIEHMVDEIAGWFARPTPVPEDWRDAMRASAWQDWEMYQRHPWILPALATSRPPLGPNVLAATEWCMAALGRVNMSAGERFETVVTIDGFVQGTAMAAIKDANSTRASGITTHGWWDQRASHLRGQFSSGRFPHLSQLLDDWEDKTPQATFAFGLERLLDGIDLYLKQRAGRIT